MSCIGSALNASRSFQELAIQLLLMGFCGLGVLSPKPKRAFVSTFGVDGRGWVGVVSWPGVVGEVAGEGGAGVATGVIS